MDPYLVSVDPDQSGRVPGVPVGKRNHSKKKPEAPMVGYEL
jgi:hypothetical protein